MTLAASIYGIIVSIKSSCRMAYKQMVIAESIFGIIISLFTFIITILFFINYKCYGSIPYVTDDNKVENTDD